MNDAEFEAQRERVKRIIDRWYTPLGLRFWRITYAWDRERWEANPKTLGRCNASWQYHEAYITFYMPVVQEEDDDEHLELAVVHEYMHMLVNPMSGDQVTIFEEHTCSSLAQAFLWVRDSAIEETEQRLQPLRDGGLTP